MNKLREVALGVALALLCCSATAVADDELDVTMEVMDDLADLGNDINEMRGPLASDIDLFVDDSRDDGDFDEDDEERDDGDRGSQGNDFDSDDEELVKEFEGIEDDFEHDDVNDDFDDDIDEEDDYDEDEEVDDDEFDEIEDDDDDDIDDDDS